MSALFEQSSGTIVHQTNLDQTLELRHNPFVRVVPMTYTKESFNRPINPEINTWTGPTLEESFTELNTNWMYTAMIQSTIDGPDPTWSKDGWSFVPLHLGVYPAIPQTTDPLSARNITVKSPAIRARIDCATFEEATNSSLWVKKFNASGIDSYYGKSLHGDMYTPRVLMGHDNRFTRMIAQGTDPSCCINTTDSGITDKGNMSVLAYWTENWLNGTTTGDFTIKWLRGPAGLDSVLQKGLTHLYFSEPPSVQAVTCIPSIETAPARAVIDERTGNVRDFEILEDPVPADVAWSDSFQFRKVTEEPVWKNASLGQLFHHDVTTRYGAYNLIELE